VLAHGDDFQRQRGRRRASRFAALRSGRKEVCITAFKGLTKLGVEFFEIGCGKVELFRSRLDAEVFDMNLFTANENPC